MSCSEHQGVVRAAKEQKQVNHGRKPTFRNGENYTVLFILRNKNVYRKGAFREKDHSTVTSLRSLSQDEAPTNMAIAYAVNSNLTQSQNTCIKKHLNINLSTSKRSQQG